MAVVSAAGQHRAKHPKWAFAGPYGHPFHPVTVTVPIGAWVASVVFGIIDLLSIPQSTKALRSAVTHLTINLVVVVLFVVNFALRASAGYEKADVTGFVLALIGIALLGASGWLGGKLAYRYGVRVAAEETQREGFA
ncbi:MAG: DUF2231 domain-containing protein [Kribbellaceae bacterium]|nr:DUF2231 domain-containing protein [Catenulispora sp.]NUR96173.1 DUF2231 domain-containing protein [Kribbellaceae bacterium]